MENCYCANRVDIGMRIRIRTVYSSIFESEFIFVEKCGYLDKTFEFYLYPHHFHPYFWAVVTCKDSYILSHVGSGGAHGGPSSRSLLVRGLPVNYSPSIWFIMIMIIPSLDL
jgi:hypothetical protein